jgi:hypothetical protein
MSPVDDEFAGRGNGTLVSRVVMVAPPNRLHKPGTGFNDTDIRSVDHDVIRDDVRCIRKERSRKRKSVQVLSAYDIPAGGDQV